MRMSNRVQRTLNLLNSIRISLFFAVFCSLNYTKFVFCIITLVAYSVELTIVPPIPFCFYDVF